MFILKPTFVHVCVNVWLLYLFSQVSLLFEVENLAMASPATVSRCGMVYNDYVDLGWKPFVQSWLDKRHKVGSTRGCWTGTWV